MDEEQESIPYPSRRRQERIWFKYRVELEFTEGSAVRGITKDITLHGLFISTSSLPVGVKVGDAGMLRLRVLNLKREFPCRVIHVQPDGVGVALQQESEAFRETWTTMINDSENTLH